jgi:hypothetical protein
MRACYLDFLYTKNLQGIWRGGSMENNQTVIKVDNVHNTLRI